MPEHGEERNRHTHREIRVTDFVDTTTGEPINIPYVAQQGTRAERWCAKCEEWVLVGSGLQGWLIGFIICPQCNTDWREKL
jgi:hypothetical protein